MITISRSADVLAILGGSIVVIGVCTAVFFFGGFFDVAASQQDPALATWAIARVREASITRHATVTSPRPLDTAAAVTRGAEAYSDLGCETCHGGLGAKPARFSRGLNPQPNLKAVIQTITPEQLFWVLKNGIKMTAMPSFGSGDRPVPDGDLWALVAFLKQVPSLSQDDLQKWTAAHRGGA